MSFWPFSNSLNSNSQLQKYLDSVQDLSSISVDDLLTDAVLLQELISELHNIKGNYSNNYPNFQFLQQTDSNNSFNSDTASLTSSNTDFSNTNNSKDARGAKLIEILLQPHILSGFLDNLVDSVDFFHKLTLKEEQELNKLLGNDENNVQNNLDDDVEIGQAEDKDDADTDSKSQKDGEDESSEDKQRRIIQASSDILSIDLWVILNRILETPIIIEKLWLILLLENLQESSPSVSYLVHILDQLMDTNSIEFLNYIRRQKGLVDTFLNKIEIPMLMDFFLRIIQTDKQESPTGILETLHLQKLIPKLIDILKPHPSQFVESSANIPNHELFFKQTAATDFIKALVTISSNTALAVVLETNIGPNQLTRELVSPEIINTMINDIMLYKVSSYGSTFQTNKHGINNCVGIIIELIRKNNSDYDLNCGSYSSMLNNDGNGGGEINSYVMYQWLKDFDQNPPGPRDPIYLGDMLKLFSENLDKFSELMELKPSVPSRVDKNSNILGFTKFKFSELIAELLHCSNMILLNSRRIKSVISIRDSVRLQQNERLKAALEEPLISADQDATDSPIQDVTSGLDDISLDNIQNETSNEKADDIKLGIDENDHKYMLEALEDEEASDDDEPSISPENPFVCDERDKSIRSNPCVGDYFKTKLVDLKILSSIISKFTQYPWHNFFHNVVFDLIQQIFNGKLNSYNSFLIVDLFNNSQCNLTDLIADSYQDSCDPRPGYMGHLILISEEVVKFTSLYKPDLISPIIVNAISSEKWDWFVNDILLKTREVYNVVLGAEQDDEDEEDPHHHKPERDHDSFGFDSSTVGYLDLESYDHNNGNNKHSIILGDRDNHDAFINDGQHDFHDGEDDDQMEEARVPDVRIENLSPNRELENNENLDDEFDSTERYHENDFLENLSGSSSSDEENEDEDNDDVNDHDQKNDSNELRRVPKHNN